MKSHKFKLIDSVSKYCEMQRCEICGVMIFKVNIKFFGSEGLKISDQEFIFDEDLTCNELLLKSIL